MRILHLPLNIANQPGYLARAQRRAGHEAEVWEFGDNAFGFPKDRRIDIYAGDTRLIWDAFADAVGRFDVFHFNFGRSFFTSPWPIGAVPPFWDLPVLRSLGKKVFFTFHGTDCRTRRVQDAENPWSFYRYADIPVDDDRVEQTVEIIRTYANKMLITSPEYAIFVPDAELQPRTLDLQEWPKQPPAQREIPKILHVPSARGTKGTHIVVEGLRALEEDGVKFEFVLLEGAPHSEAMRAIADADIVIDNVLTGDYEVVSLEAMACNRVPVAYRQSRSKTAFPDAPVFEVDPPSFPERMRALVEDVSQRRALAQRGRDFMAHAHDAPVVAARLLELYEQDAPAPALAYPDWSPYGSVRAKQRLDRMLSKSESQRARATEYARHLAARLGETPPSFGPDPLRSSATDRLKLILPDAALRRLRHARVRAMRWVRADPRRAGRARALLAKARALRSGRRPPPQSNA